MLQIITFNGQEYEYVKPYYLLKVGSINKEFPLDLLNPIKSNDDDEESDIEYDEVDDDN